MGAAFPMLETLPAVGGGPGEDKGEPDCCGEEECRHGHDGSAPAALTPWTASATASILVEVVRMVAGHRRRCLRQFLVHLRHHHRPQRSFPPLASNKHDGVERVIRGGNWGNWESRVSSLNWVPEGGYRRINQRQTESLSRVSLGLCDVDF